MRQTAPFGAVLIHFSGPDAPGLTAELTGILAQYGVSILDIGQSVVHESLSLGMLIDVNPARLGSLEVTLASRARELGLSARVKPVPEEALRHWMRNLHQSHFVVTMLGWSITARDLSRVSAIVSTHGMNVDRIEGLTTKRAGGTNR